MRLRYSYHFSISALQTPRIRYLRRLSSSCSSIVPCLGVPCWCSSGSLPCASWPNLAVTCTADSVWTCSCWLASIISSKCQKIVSNPLPKSNRQLSESSQSIHPRLSTSPNGMASYVYVSWERTRLSQASSALSRSWRCSTPTMWHITHKSSQQILKQ